MVENASIEVRLDRFAVARFRHDPIHVPVEPNETINFNHTIHLKVVDETQTIATRLDVEIVRASNGEILASISTEAAFKLGKGYEKLKSLGGIPRDLMLLAINLTYSTTRGIMIEKFRGTPLHSAYLPIINPNELLEKIEKASGKTKVAAPEPA